MEGASQRMIIVAHADGALNPPVRRVQAMGMVLPGDRQARPRELGDELAPREDPDVAAPVVVVLIRELPADPLRQPGGHPPRGNSPRSTDPGDLVYHALACGAGPATL